MKKNKYLFIPVQPTPNGRLHIGHISGPYLKSDVLARNLRMLGHDVSIISGVDTFEAHVCLKAVQEGETPEAVNDKYHGLMVKDLEALDIRFDQYINPLDADHRRPFEDMHLALYNALVDAGRIEWCREKFFKRDDGRVLNGCWIRGQCSRCDQPMKGFYCEECGANLRPEQIVNPYFVPSLAAGESVAEVEDRCAYLRVDPERLKHAWRKMQLPARFIEIAESFLEPQARVRMTTPDRWGIRVDAAEAQEEQVLFSYTTLFFYAVYCAELYARAVAAPVHPFEPASEVITVASFGVDNTNAYLVGVMGAAYGLGLKPFDHYLTNYFFQLDHKKIASSSGHAIWAEDLVVQHGFPADAARMFILSVNPQHGPSNFTLAACTAFHREVYVGSLLAKCELALARCERRLSKTVDSLVKARLHVAFARQQACFALPRSDLKAATDELLGWLAFFDEVEAAGAGLGDWLLGLALLSHAIAPTVSAHLRSSLGLSEPQILLRCDLLDCTARHQQPSRSSLLDAEP